jgi:hypothetical protein
MRSKWLWAGALAAAVGAGGCAHQPKVDEAKLGQLSMAEKDGIFAAQHNVTVAEANEETAKRALSQGRQFRDIADTELKAAKKQEELAAKSVELGRGTNSPTAVCAAQKDQEVAARERVAAGAKADYANRLVALRSAELKLAEEAVKSARFDLGYTEAVALQRKGIDPGVKMDKLARSRDGSRVAMADDQRTVALLRDEENASHTAWEAQRSAFNVAERQSPAPVLPEPRFIPEEKIPGAQAPPCPVPAPTGQGGAVAPPCPETTQGTPNTM